MAENLSRQQIDLKKRSYTGEGWAHTRGSTRVSYFEATICLYRRFRADGYRAYDCQPNESPSATGACTSIDLAHSIKFFGMVRFWTMILVSH